MGYAPVYWAAAEDGEAHAAVNGTSRTVAHRDEGNWNTVTNGPNIRRVRRGRCIASIGSRRVETSRCAACLAVVAGMEASWELSVASVRGWAAAEDPPFVGRVGIDHGPEGKIWVWSVA